MAITVRPLTPTIGAVIEGIDLAQPLDEIAVKAVQDALLDHLVIFLRDQEMTPEQYKAFGEHFGDLNKVTYFQNLGAGLEEIHLIDVQGSESRGTYSDQWHTDLTDQEEPPLGSILRPQQLPALGGDTLWANMYAAYEALSPTLRELILPMSAVHQTPRSGPVEHPVVRTHPVTRRKSLFVNRVFTRSIVGLPAEESDAILRLLCSHAESVDFQIRWTWRMGDVAFWDNRATQHYAVHDYDGRRVMQRMTLKGDRPFH